MSDALERLRAADPVGAELPPPLPGGPPARPAPRRGLSAANLLLLVTVALHGIDHAFHQQRGLHGLELHVFLIGLSMGGASLASFVAALRDSPNARPFAVIAGGFIGLAALLGHFLPRSTAPLLDPYSGLGLDAFSWGAAAAVVIAGALTVLAAARSR